MRSRCRALISDSFEFKSFDSQSQADKRIKFEQNFRIKLKPNTMVPVKVWKIHSIFRSYPDEDDLNSRSVGYSGT